MSCSSSRWLPSFSTRRLLLWGAGVVLTLGVVAGAQAQDEGIAAPVEEDLQEVYLTFEYAGVVSTMVEARYGGNQFYLSVSDIFAALQIEYERAEDGRSASGFFVDEERTYRIDVDAGTITFEGETFELTSADFVAENARIFLRTNVFAEVFGMNFTPSFRQVALELEFPQETPVEAATERQQQRTFDQVDATRPDFALLRDRGFDVLDGLVVDYGLQTSYSDSELSSRYSLRAGAELIGGDVQGNFSGELSPTGMDFRVQSGRWRLVTDTPILRQTRLGWIQSSGLRNFSLRGFQITNEPVRAREMYGTYRVRGETEPGWEVELYVNGQLIDAKEVNGDGQYFFDVPISYGTTRITLREFGPTGQVNEEERRLDVPFSFVPRGRVYYSVEGGEARTPPLRIVQSEASVGLTDWLTAGGGYEYAFDVPERFGAGERHPFGEFAARLAPGYVLSGTVSPDLRNRVSLNGVFPSATSFELTYGRYYPNSVYNRSEAPHAVEGRASFGVPFLGQGGNFRIRTEHEYEDERGYTHRLRPSLSTTLFAGLRVRGSYQARLSQRELREIDFFNRSQDLQLDLSYSVPVVSGTWTPLGRTRLSLQSEYDVEERRLDRLRFDLSRRLGSVGRASLDLTHQVPSGMTSGSFRLTLDLPNVRSSTSSSIRRGRLRVSQDVNGALALDPRTGTLNFSRRGWVGQSSAALRLFVDVNGNDTLDEGEELIENGRVRFRRAVRTRTTGDGLIRTTGLQAYEQYNVTVDQTSIPNPLWVPRQEEFSFVTDPNSFTPVDVPFYVAGVVEGSARRRTETGTEPIPGLDVIVREISGDFRKKIDVFNEGSFYDYQIPPGRYVIHVDSTQLRKLDLRSEPSIREFVVEHTAQGDQVSGLNFELVPRGDAPPPVAQQSETEAPASTEEASEEGAPAVGHEYFSIQLGAFSTYRTAQDYVDHADILFDRPVSIRFKPDREVFAVEIDSFATRTEAAKMLETFQQRPYLSNAFIAEKTGEDAEVNYSIQLAAFSDRENADEYAGGVEGVFDRAVQVRYKEDPGVFAVEIDDFESRREATRTLEAVRARPNLANAFVVGREATTMEPRVRYALQVGAYRNSELAESRAETLRNRVGGEGLDVEILASEENELYRVVVNPTSDRSAIEALRARLAEEYGITESFVTRLESGAREDG